MPIRSELLANTLKELNSSSADVEGSAVISTDGLVMSAVLPGGMDEARVGAMSAALESLGARTAKELGRGTLEQVLVKGSAGYVLMVGAGPDAVLGVLASKDAKLGLVFLDARRAAEAITKVV